MMHSRRAFLSGVLAWTAATGPARVADDCIDEVCSTWLTKTLRTEGGFDGKGGILGIHGRIDLPPRATLQNVTLRQLDPAGSQSVVTLQAHSVDSITLRNLKIDRNGTGENSGKNTPPNGPIASAFGMRIIGGRGHSFENIEVFGNDAGTAVQFKNIDWTSKIDGIYVHDILAIVPGAKDDVLQGILFETCDGLSITGLRCERLGWSAQRGGPIDFDNSRGIAISGCRNCIFLQPRCDSVGQGIDFSGDLNGGNHDCIVESARMLNCGTVGVKFANLTKRSRAVSCESEYCTLFGFVDGSSFDTPVNDTDANFFIGCSAINCGTVTGTTGGFVKLPGRRKYSNLPWFIDCLAEDRRVPPKMRWGFHNEVEPRSNASARLINCQSYGHTIAPTSGF